MSTPLRWRVRAAFVALVVTAAAGCDSPADVSTHDHPAPSFLKTGTGLLPDLAGAVRKGTARFHSTAQAAQAGYAVASPCVAVPGLGGMGFHWSRGDLIDPVFEPLAPEVLVYAPGPEGQLQLAAVEYIVINVGQQAPTFGNQPFDVGGTPVPVPHWSLHVWVHKDNPNGLFTPFNPDVTCG